MKQSIRAGFTLVELAIVLVIIGLLVGGVLVAQDLIKAAEIRAVSSDIERYNTGAAAFRTRYNGVPGDLLGTSAQNFGLAYGDGNDGEGDGDGTLENNAVAASKGGLGGENILFWTHLSQAQYIPFGSNTYTTAAGANAALAAINTGANLTTSLTNSLPQLRIRDSGFIHAFGIGGQNYYLIASWTAGATPAEGQLIAGAGLSPREALGIDEKVDDGKPDAGVARSSGGALSAMTAATLTGGNATPVAGTHCYDSDAPAAYATASDDVANAVACSLRIRTGF